MTTRLVAKMLALLEHHGYQWGEAGPPPDLRIDRTRAGWHQRRDGAWSWFFFSYGHSLGSRDVGSQWPANYLARLRPDEVFLYTNRVGQTAILPTPQGMARVPLK